MKYDTIKFSSIDTGYLRSSVCIGAKPLAGLVLNANLGMWIFPVLTNPKATVTPPQFA